MATEAGTAPGPPTYKVFRDQHGIPQFEPKRGTQALKDALSYEFPALGTELQLMQAALRKFFDSERCTQFVCELPENDLQASLAKKREIPVSPVQATKATLRNWKVAQRTPSRPSSRASSRASSRGRSRASSRGPAGSSRSENAGPNLEPLVEIRGSALMTTWNLSNGQELEKRKRQPYDPVKRRKVAENRGNACDKHRASKTTCDPDECPQNKLHLKAADGPPTTTRGRVTQTILHQAKPITQISSEIDNKEISTETLPGADAHDQQISSHGGAEVFWDALEQDSRNLHARSSVASFGDMVSNDSGYWTDNDQLGPLSWSSSSNYPAFPDQLENNYFAIPVDNSDVVDGSSGLLVLELACNEANSNSTNSRIVEAHGVKPLLQDSPSILDEDPHRTYTTLLLENRNHIPSAPQSEEALMCNEDPFMGWGDKKANRLFDDYGWVLSHVENL